MHSLGHYLPPPKLSIILLLYKAHDPLKVDGDTLKIWTIRQIKLVLSGQEDMVYILFPKDTAALRQYSPLLLTVHQRIRSDIWMNRFCFHTVVCIFLYVVSCILLLWTLLNLSKQAAIEINIKKMIVLWGMWIDHKLLRKFLRIWNLRNNVLGLIQWGILSKINMCWNGLLVLQARLICCSCNLVVAIYCLLFICSHCLSHCLNRLHILFSHSECNIEVWEVKLPKDMFLGEIFVL